MMSDVGIGKLITSEQKRDAIHVAVAPVVAQQKLYPGQRIGLVERSQHFVEADPGGEGIVDPFLLGPVFPDQSFWMFLMPNTVTGMRHEWQHPAFQPLPDEMNRKIAADPEGVRAATDLENARSWMQDFARECRLSYEEVISAGREYVKTGEYFTQYNDESARDAIYCGNNKKLFWDNFEILTGVKVSEEDRDGSVFSCSC